MTKLCIFLVTVAVCQPLLTNVHGKSSRVQVVDLGDLGVGNLGGGYSSANGINVLGVVGVSPTADNANHAFLYSRGKIVPLGTLYNATGINDRSEVCGDAILGINNDAVIFSKGQMTDLGSLTGNASEAFAINDRGEVVGDWTLGDGGQHAFLYSKSKGMKDLGTLGSTFSIAYAVNNSGRVVGVTNTGTGITVAFIYEDGTMKDLNAFIPSSSGWSLIKATGINDVGQIVGTGVFNGLLRGFLLTGVQ